MVRSTYLNCHESPNSDRKSTRLNSSHSQISYAVFCLKKKKKHYDESLIIVEGVLQSHGHTCLTRGLDTTSDVYCIPATHLSWSASLYGRVHSPVAELD